jgi:hypothetical protein
MTGGMVIGFYPGAGGHRYYNSLINRSFGKSETVYDNAPTDYNARYTTNQSHSTYTDIVSSHCVNYTTLKNCYVNQNNFTIIRSDLKRSLFREYRLIGRERYLRNKIQAEPDSVKLEHYQHYKDSAWPDVYTIKQYYSLPAWIQNEVNNDRKQVAENIDFLAAEATIEFHYDYYNQYPFEIGGAKIVDIDQDDNEFCAVMRQELAVPFSEEFNQAWENIVG